MTEHHIETISALWDGEPVDPDALEAALADPGARAALVDFARLRAHVRSDPEPLPATLSTLRRDTSGWLTRRVPVGAVAALLLLMLVAGWLLPRPPLVQSPAGPPRPTRTIAFEPGVDWQAMP
jgi:negative regulator of sigma E activity